MKFAQPAFLWALLVAVPAIAGFFYWSWTVKQKLIRAFVSARLLGSLSVGVSPRRQFVRMGLLGGAIVGILLALARPQWGTAWQESHQRGLDIVIAIDTSRSMLSQDVVPNRLERAKLAAFDLMNQARNDRLALVVFAGTAFLQTPLTVDDQAFRQGLEAVNIGIVPEGGTSLSSAISTALQAFEKNNDNHKVLILFTDGEDHDSDAETIAAAKRAADAGMHIFTVGVGTKEGDLIRVKDDQGNSTFVKDDNGNAVQSKLNEGLLKQIASTANGVYLHLEGADQMQQLYARDLAPLPKTESTTRFTKVYVERYHWFLVAAVLCLIAEYLLPESPKRQRRGESSSSARKEVLQTTAALICLCILAPRIHASPSSAYGEYQSGDFKGAFEEFNRLSEKNTNDYRLHYDAAAAAYRAKDMEKAEKQFNATLSTPSVAPDVTTQERTYYDLGNTEYHLGESMKDADKKQERWEQAIAGYTNALHLNTNDLDAKNNLAYVQRQLEELKKQQQQQQKQQGKNQKNQKDQKDQKQQGQNQKNQQNKQNQQQSGQQDQQQKQDQQKQDEEKQKQEQAQRDQEKQQQEHQAQGNPQENKDKPEEAGQPGEMSPKEARELLNEQKGDEKTLVFQPDNKQDQSSQKKIRDW